MSRRVPSRAPMNRPTEAGRGPEPTGNKGVGKSGAPEGGASGTGGPAGLDVSIPVPDSGAFVEATVVPMGPDGWTARAQGVVWSKGRIRFVGSSGQAAAEARRLGLEPRRMDGRMVLPGFVDAHTHFLHVGVKTTRPDLRGAKSLKEALARVTAWLKAHPGPEPVIAEGWDESEWGDGAARPTKEEVDSLQAGRPVVLRRICGHVAVAGSAALPLVRKRWDDDAAVDLRTGLLLEAPSLYLNEVLPSTPAQLDKAVQQACAEAHRLGLSAVGDYSQAPYRAALQRAAARGTLTVRVASSIYVQQLDAEVKAGFRTGRTEGTSEWMQDGGLKVFLDGSLGGHTAYLREPYDDLLEGGESGSSGDGDDHAGHAHGAGGTDEGSSSRGLRGTRVWTDEELDHHMGTAHAAGVQVHAHAIGDGAIDQGLAAFGRLAARADLEGKGWGGNPLRHRFEHFEIAHDDQVARAVELGLVSSSQPNFVGEWSAKGGMYHARLGDRFLLNNRFRTFKRAGLPLAFGSDGMPFGPLPGLASAVHHPEPAERLEPLEAAWHYTWMAAWSLHWPGLGHLASGNPADLVVIEGDPEGTPRDWRTLQTVTGGVPRLIPPTAPTARPTARPPD